MNKVEIREESCIFPMNTKDAEKVGEKTCFEMNEESDYSSMQKL